MEMIKLAMTTQAGVATVVNDSKKDFRKISDKQYKKVDKFDGLDKNWKKFEKSFMVATKMADEDTWKFMNQMVLEDDLVTLDDMLIIGYAGDHEHIKKRSVELFDVLTLMIEGEGAAIVQSISDCDGLGAWQKVYRNYNMVSTAKTMSKVIQVVSPPKVIDLTTMRGSIENWEAKERELETETKAKIPEVFRMAILTTMCPPSIQDYVFQQSTPNQKYKELKEKIVSLTHNRVAMMDGGPVPMEIGGMNLGNQFEQFQRFQEHQHREQVKLRQQVQFPQQHQTHFSQGNVETEDNFQCAPCGQGQQEYYEGAVGRFTQCYTCGGYGHLARDCQKGGGKGKGKDGKGMYGKGFQNFQAYNGGKDGGKGFGKDGGKGMYGKGGKGFGYQGSCFKCGRVGHKQAECRAINHIDGWTFEEHLQGQREEQTVAEDKPVGVGSVWMMTGNVSKCHPIPKTEIVTSPKPKMSHVKQCKVTNRFSPFEELNEEIHIESPGDENEVLPPPGLGAVQQDVFVLGRQAQHIENKSQKQKKKGLFVGTVQVVRKEPRKTLTEIKESLKERSLQIDEMTEELAQKSKEIELIEHASGKSCGVRQVSGTEAVEVNVVSKKPDLATGKCGITFHVTKAKKMLVSVERLTAAGNLVTFGPSNDYCFIENLATKRRINMKKRGGVYEVDVMFQVAERWMQGTLTIDSGAEENVMPRDWFTEVELGEKKEGLKFM